MYKLLWKSLAIGPAFLGATLAFGASATLAAGNQTAANLTAEPQTNVIPSLETQLGVETAPNLALDRNAAGLSTNSIDSKLALPSPNTLTPPEIRVAQAVPRPSSSPASNPNVLQQVIQYGNEGGKNSAGQVTSVSQLRDVQPTDWAFQALQSLVERYGCIEGYPDRTYRGNRALTRYEFAAGLNSCLDRINELIAAATADLPSKEDLATIQRLIEEFQAELATLRGRVDALEARTRELEANQFSTTTKLKGEAIFVVTDTFGGGDSDGDGDDNNTVFQDRVRLDFQTSFSGRDVLHTRLAAGNATAFQVPGGTFEATQQFNIGGNTGNDIILDWLAYEFPIFGNSRGYVAATGGIFSDFTPTNNPYFEDYDGGNGALSSFAQESPIYRIGGGAGAAINLAVGRGGSVFRPTSLTVGYLAGPGANNPFDKEGLFDGDYAGIAQLNFSVSDTFGFALTYVHGYHNADSAIFDLGGSPRNSGGNGGVVGTSLANFPSFAASGGSGRPVVTNSYGVEAALRISKNFSISGFASYTDAIIIGRGGAEIWTYGAGIAFPNFGREGNVLGLFAGVQPYLKELDVPGGDGDFDDDTPYHAEAFYKFQVTDNISVTPGVIWLLSPNQNDDNDDIFIGTLRTTFSF